MKTASDIPNFQSQSLSRTKEANSSMEEIGGGRIGGGSLSNPQSSDEDVVINGDLNLEEKKQEDEHEQNEIEHRFNSISDFLETREQVLTHRNETNLDDLMDGDESSRDEGKTKKVINQSLPDVHTTIQMFEQQKTQRSNEDDDEMTKIIEANKRWVADFNRNKKTLQKVNTNKQTNKEKQNKTTNEIPTKLDSNNDKDSDKIRPNPDRKSGEGQRKELKRELFS
eukprot:UN32525